MIYLVEIDAVNNLGVPVTLYFSTDGYTTRPTDTPANVYYDPRIEDPGNFQRFLFGPGTTRGGSEVGVGDIVLAAGDPGNGLTTDPLLSYGFDGRAVRIKTVASPMASISTAVTLFRGTAKQLENQDAVNRISLQINDRLIDIDKPLLTTRYAGTTTGNGPTIEGNVNLKDQIKPRIWGTKWNAPGVQVNPFDLIYQFSASAVNSLVIYDGAHVLINAGDFPTIAALVGWAQIPGWYATCLAHGCGRLGADPEKEVTADVVEGATAADRTAAQVARRMLLNFGLTTADVPAASFAALDLLNAADVGELVNDESTALEVVQRVLDSIGGWITPDHLGVFRVGRLQLPTGPSATTYSETEFLSELSLLPVLDEGDGLPAWRTTVRWGYVGLVQGQDGTFASVPVARRTFVASEYRESKVENAAVKTKHSAAVEIVIESRFAYEAAAIAEATRRQALYGQRLIRYRFPVDVSVAGPAQIGTDITLVDRRLGLAAGKMFKVIGRIDEYEENTVTLDVFGAA